MSFSKTTWRQHKKYDMSYKSCKMYENKTHLILCNFSLYSVLNIYTLTNIHTLTIWRIAGYMSSHLQHHIIFIHTKWNMKLHEITVSNADSNKNILICKTVIDLAHECESLPDITITAMLTLKIIIKIKTSCSELFFL
jgi:hypothetical protein